MSGGGVGVMESTENWGPDDMVRFGRAASAGSRGVAQRLVAATIVVVADEHPKDSPEVPFAEDNDMVEALASERSIDAFAEAILPGRLRRCLDRFDAENANAVIEPWSKDLVAVVNQEPRFRTIARKRFDHLAQRPSSGRVRRDVEMNDAPAVVTEDHEAIQKLE